MEHFDPAVSKRFEIRASRPCEFCKELDPQFLHRHPLDQAIAANRKSAASGHLTEDGYVRHRMLELSQMVSKRPRSAA